MTEATTGFDDDPFPLTGVPKQMSDLDQKLKAMALSADRSKHDYWRSLFARAGAALTKSCRWSLGVLKQIAGDRSFAPCEFSGFELCCFFTCATLPFSMWRDPRRHL